MQAARSSRRSPRNDEAQPMSSGFVPQLVPQTSVSACGGSQVPSPSATVTHLGQQYTRSGDSLWQRWSEAVSHPLSRVSTTRVAYVGSAQTSQQIPRALIEVSDRDNNRGGVRELFAELVPSRLHGFTVASPRGEELNLRSHRMAAGALTSRHGGHNAVSF